MDCTNIRLKYGDNNSRVGEAQNLLRNGNFYSGAIDNDFGKKTLQAVKDCQVKNKMKVVKMKDFGVFGPNTCKLASKLPQKTALLLRAENAFGGFINTATRLYVLTFNSIYSHYKNDCNPQGKALAILEAGGGLNCADFAQLGYWIILEINKVYGTHYEVEIIHAKCKPSLVNGHYFLRVRGEEFGSKWIDFDLSEAASAKKGIGHTMCINGYKVHAINEPNMIKDDGI